MLEKRYSIMIMHLLIESNSRGKKIGKMAYIWINKYRLGLEKMTKWQEEYFLRAFVSTAICLYRRLYSIYCIHFENFHDNCWVKDDTFLNNNNECDPYFWNKHPHQGIKVRLSSTTVEKRTIQEDDKYIYVSTYTANANSLPGNEYWMKKISTNKDSTTVLASRSFISELHNPLVNRTMVSGKNLYIATDYGVKHLSDYCCEVLENNIF
ncbi:uncharacterized protein LOC129798374 [Phlebotomus papatasi]|uniref:uncharacterized protein LOC129798374 n=1 Tax=Phlebotomus papatasi TaxID=29031 RepID=UPI0024833EA1|nr:uncharacterized protein LOC129798374 [Phlebotomus papatasi]